MTDAADPNVLETIADVVELPLNAQRHFGTAERLVELWFRGQPRSGLPIRPKLFRRDATKYATDKDRETAYKALESSLYYEFMNRTPSRRATHPDSDDHLDWMLLAQHYGLETRMLDWTTSPIVALYFAVCERCDEPGEILVLHPGALNEPQGHGRVLFSSAGAAAQSFARRVISNKPYTNDVWAVKPTELDIRVQVQHAAITIHDGPQPLEARGDAPRVLHRYVVPAAKRFELQRRLHWIGVHRSTLFPDLATLASYVNERFSL